MGYGLYGIKFYQNGYGMCLRKDPVLQHSSIWTGIYIVHELICAILLQDSMTDQVITPITGC